MKKLSLNLAGALSLFFLPACGASDDAPAGDGAGNGTGDTPGASTENGELPSCTPDSPVGEPCVDDYGAVLCPKDSPFPGNGLALCDQGPEAGMLLHYGPLDYDDPDDVAIFLLGPGGENENCTYIRTPNSEVRFTESYRGRMRPGSHHLIVTIQDESTFQETRIPTGCGIGNIVNDKWLVGSQDPQIDLAISGGGIAGYGGSSVPEPGDPDYGLGQRIDPHTPLQVNMHYTNPTDETILREAWMWFDYVDEADVETFVDMITFYQGEINVPPLQTATTAKARCVAPEDRYVGLVTGHAHGAMTRFSIWHEDGSGNEELVYETYDWAEPGNLFYSRHVQNPAPDPVALTHGGSSGYLLVRQGEALTFECEYDNPTEQTLTLGNRAGDEMCNVFGMYYPTNGDLWNCACLGPICVDRVPSGFSP